MKEAGRHAQALFSSGKLKFYIGDVRDYQSVLCAMRGVDFVFPRSCSETGTVLQFHP